jgi:hypothetical protein
MPFQKALPSLSSIQPNSNWSPVGKLKTAAVTFSAHEKNQATGTSQSLKSCICHHRRSDIRCTTTTTTTTTKQDFYYRT